MLTNQIIAWNFKQLLNKELMMFNFQVRERSLSVCPGRIWEGPAGERRNRSSSVFAIRDNDNTVIDITDNTDYDETEARCQATRRSRSHSQPIGQMIHDIESRKVKCWSGPNHYNHSEVDEEKVRDKSQNLYLLAISRFL